MITFVIAFNKPFLIGASILHRIIRCNMGLLHRNFQLIVRIHQSSLRPLGPHSTENLLTLPSRHFPPEVRLRIWRIPQML